MHRIDTVAVKHVHHDGIFEGSFVRGKFRESFVCGGVDVEVAEEKERFGGENSTGREACGMGDEVVKASKLIEAGTGGGISEGRIDDTVGGLGMRGKEIEVGSGIELKARIKGTFGGEPTCSERGDGF
jgi:hypothetical protein